MASRNSYQLVLGTDVEFSSQVKLDLDSLSKAGLLLPRAGAEDLKVDCVWQYVDRLKNMGAYVPPSVDSALTIVI